MLNTLSEIEAAADALPVEEKELLLLFLTSRLRAAGAELPEPRQFSREVVADWIAEDIQDMQSLSKQP